MGIKQSRAGARSFLTSLLRDVRANTLAVMAMSIIPLAGMVGGGVDISRMYIVKTRLQHACDAGTLAGRKAMGAGVWAQTVNGTANYPNQAAEKFFDANYNSAAYGASNVQRSFSESAGKVTGTASADLPMTLMRIFGRTTETLQVACASEMRLPNTDVMFVLDTTGSMDQDDGTGTKKIVGLRVAVKCFYEIVARLDTDANCTTGNPSGGTGDQVQIRFGFMPYSTNVNVGKLLPTSYFPDSWDYQTRKARWTNTGTSVTLAPTADTPGTNGTGSPDPMPDWVEVETKFLSCPAKPADSTTTGSYSYDTAVQTLSDGSKQWTTRTYTQVRTEYRTSTVSYLFCRLDKRVYGTGSYTTVVHTQQATSTQNRTFAGWDYYKWPINISGLKNGTAWNDSFTVKEIGTSGADQTVSWNGCIEERKTVTGTNFSPIPSDARDLDIDTAPEAGNVDTMWKPSLPAIVYARRNTVTQAYTTDQVTITGLVGNLVNNTLSFGQPNAYCPVEARKLVAWTDANAFDDYVDSLTPTGNTYHDIGLLWGARFLSPTGIFKSENEYTPKGGEIERHLIFMTDGDTQTNTGDLAAYGYPWYDRRNVSSVGNSPGATDMDAEVNARFAALCTAIKNKNITLWVIAFGSMTTDTETRLQTCATTSRYFKATNSAQLQNTFKSIADQISMLRLTR